MSIEENLENSTKRSCPVEQTEQALKVPKTDIVSETKFGITVYTTSGPGFYGVVKQRYSDFLVREIDNEGNVARLGEWSVEQDTAEKDTLVQEEIEEKLNNWFSTTDVQKIINQDFTGDIVSKTIDEKAERTELHQFFSAYLDYCNTVTNPSNQIRVEKKTASNSTRSRNKGNSKYISAILYKENKDTNEVIQRLSSFLRIKPSAISYAGNKDKRAITLQRMVFEGTSLDKLSLINQRIHNIRLSDPKIVEKPLKLGELKGNRFEVVLRQVDNEQNARDAIEALKVSGFINYFGMQRFGTAQVSTCDIGEQLFKNDYEKAVELVMLEKDTDDEMTLKARALYKEGKYKEAFHCIPKRHASERQILQYFAFNQVDCKKAFNSINWEMRTMYVHSFQSLIWNTMASKRLLLGKSPLVGDLVLVNGSVKCLSEEDLSKFTIYNVVLPMPGHSIIYPSNEIGEAYQQLMREKNVDLNNKSDDKLLNLPGSYRNIVVNPEDVEYEFKKYTDVTIPLIKSDIDSSNELNECDDQDAHLALVIKFSLPSSTYATMLLREIMKMETSSQYQRTIN